MPIPRVKPLLSAIYRGLDGWLHGAEARADTAVRFSSIPRFIPTGVWYYFGTNPSWKNTAAIRAEYVHQIKPWPTLPYIITG